MTRFRPCIDLHSGQVKQIVGGTLSEEASQLKTNHVSTLPAEHFAKLYKENNATGAHIIMLGPNNEDAVISALQVWPKAFQVGGGIKDTNAGVWILTGADKVIVTSYLFPDATFSMNRLEKILYALNHDRDRLVIDLSCRRKGDTWFVAMDKWQKLTDMEINQENIRMLESHCSEFLVHAADNEGLQKGIDEDLVKRLAEWCSIPVTYAGGGRHLDDLKRVQELSGGKVDLTIGSALDIFGGEGVTFAECIAWNNDQAK